MDQNETIWKRAESHAASQQWSEARALYLQLSQQSGKYAAAALLQLSYIESLAGDYRRARGLALQAAAIYSGDPSIAAELLSRLRTFNESGAFHQAVKRLPSLTRISIPVLNAIAAQLSYHNEQDKALPLLNEAVRGDPDFPPSLVARGQVLMYLGRFEQAYSDLTRCVRRAPRLAQAWWLLSRLGRHEGRHARIDSLRGLLANASWSADQASLLCFALHNELDAEGEYDEAWSVLKRACQAKRSLLRYSPTETEQLFDALMRMPLGQSQVPAAGDVERHPIFVVGMHRSGTTLLEQLLDRHEDVAGLGELYDFTHQMRYATNHHCKGVIDQEIVRKAPGVDMPGIGQRYLAGVEWRLGDRARFVDKLPSNFLNLGFICRALPGARILHLNRDPMETCFSNLRELFSDACPYSYDQMELAHYFRQYRGLMAHWQKCFPGRILDVDYRQLVTDTETEMTKVANFCNLGFERQMLEPALDGPGVATASAVQVRQPIALPIRPKWSLYEAHLQPLRGNLA